MDLNFRNSCRAKDNGLSFSTAASGVSNMLNTLNNYSKQANNPWSHLSDKMVNDNRIVIGEMNGVDNSFQAPKTDLRNPLVQAVSASVSAVQKAIMNPAMKGLEYQLNGPQGSFPCEMRRSNLFQPPGTSLPFLYGKMNDYNQQSLTYTQCPIPEENFLSLYPPLESFHSNIEMLSYPFPYCSGTSQTYSKQVPSTGTPGTCQSWSKHIPSTLSTQTSQSSSKTTPKSYKLNPEAPEYIPKMMRLSEESKLKPASDSSFSNSLSVSDSEQKGTQSSVIIGVPTQPESLCCEIESTEQLEGDTVADTEVDSLRKITTEGSCPFGQVSNDDSIQNFTSETCSDNKACILNAETSQVKESTNVPSTLVMVNEDVSPAESDLGKSNNCSMDGSVQPCVPVCEENVPKVPSLPESGSSVSLCSETDGDCGGSQVDLILSSKTEAESPASNDDSLEIVFKGEDDENATLVDEDMDEEEEDSCSSDSCSEECDTDDEDSDSDVSEESENEDDYVCFEVDDDDDDGICFSSGNEEGDEVDGNYQRETNATIPHQSKTGYMRGGGFVKHESTNPSTSQCGWDIISRILKRTSQSEDSEEKESDDEDYNCELFSVDLDDSWAMPINGVVISTLIPEASANQCDSMEKESNCLNDYDMKVIEELAASGLIIDFGSDSPAENQAEELIKVNRKWDNEIDKDWKKETPRKVNFSDHNKTHVADDCCRRGPWEQLARERMNFRRRIEEAEAILRPVFNPVHRWKVYNKLKDET